MMPRLPWARHSEALYDGYVCVWCVCVCREHDSYYYGDALVLVYTNYVNAVTIDSDRL